MKRILAILLAVLMIGTVCILTGCGEDNGNQTNIEENQKKYEALFEDTSKIEMNSTNISAVGISDGIKALEVQSKESGDMKMTMYLTETLGYTTYRIENYSYLEMHIPEYQDDNGNTVKAEDVYYKSTSGTQFVGNITTDFIDSLGLNNKENIKSVKYIETKNINNVKCDVVEVVHILNQDSEDVVDEVGMALENSDNSQVEKETENIDKEVETTDNYDATDENSSSGDEDSENQNKVVELTSTFYFVSNTNKLYGYKAKSSELELECYFVDELKIELPKDVEFVDADDETIGDKMTSLYSAAYSMVDNNNESSN